MVPLCGVWEFLRLTCFCLLCLVVICKTCSRFSYLQSSLTAVMSSELLWLCRSFFQSAHPLVREQRGVFNQVKEFRSKCWINAVDSFILISWLCSFVMARERNRLNHWIRIDHLEGTHKNHQVQLPHHFQASQKSKHIIQMCLERWQACGSLKKGVNWISSLFPVAHSAVLQVCWDPVYYTRMHLKNSDK